MSLLRLFLLRYLAWLTCTSTVILHIGAANVTFQNTSPNLSYVPALCSISSTDDNFPEDCDGLWYVNHIYSNQSSILDLKTFCFALF